MLTVSAPRPNLNTQALTEIRLGLADAYSGLDLTTLSLTTTLAINGRAAGSQLKDLVQPVGDGIYAITLTQAITDVMGARLFASVAEKQGYVTRVAVEFAVKMDGAPLPTPTVNPTPSVTPIATPGVRKVYIPVVER